MLVWTEDISSIWDQPSSGESGQGRMENVFHHSLFKYFQVKLTNLEMPRKDNQKPKSPKRKTAAKIHELFISFHLYFLSRSK